MEHTIEILLSVVGTLVVGIVTVLWTKITTQEKRMNEFEKNYIDRFAELKDLMMRVEMNLKDEIARRYHQTAQAQQTLVLDMVQNYVNKKDCSHNNE